MHRLTFLLLLWLLLLGNSIAQGQSTNLSLAGAVQTALLNNRDLRAARYTLEQAQARLQQAGRWANPEIEISGQSDVLFGNQGEAAFSAGIYQAFPLTSRLSISRQIGQLDIERAQREILNYERLLVERVRIHYIRVVSGEAKVALWKRIEKQQAEIVAAATQRLAAGQGSATESALASAAQTAAWNHLNEAETQVELDRITLKTLLGFPSDHSIYLRDSLSQITDSLRKKTGERPTVLQRSDAELLLLDTDRAELAIQLAQSEAWEGLRIGVEYTYDRGMDEPEGLGTDQFLGLKVSIPLPLWNRNQGTAAEKQALRAEMQARLEALRLEIANSLAASLREVQLLQQRVAQIRQRGITSLQTHEKDLRKGVEEGRVDLRDWLAVRSQLTELQVAEVAATAELSEAYARLGAVVGDRGWETKERKD